jgi:hypothetical protein
VILTFSTATDNYARHIAIFGYAPSSSPFFFSFTTPPPVIEWILSFGKSFQVIFYFLFFESIIVPCGAYVLYEDSLTKLGPLPPTFTVYTNAPRWFVPSGPPFPPAVLDAIDLPVVLVWYLSCSEAIMCDVLDNRY